MTHFAVLVLADTDPADPGACVERAGELLAPYDEQGVFFAEGSRWDWWTVGGRFTGRLDGYDPAADPANTETCSLCAGTGMRLVWPSHVTEEWIADCSGCNGCRGAGKRVKHSSLWAPHRGDVAPASAVLSRPQLFVPAAVVTPDGAWHEEARLGWWGLELERVESPGDWRAIVSTLLADHRDAAVVLVDCHV
jgi:hypothetical protein